MGNSFSKTKDSADRLSPHGLVWLRRSEHWRSYLKSYRQERIQILRRNAPVTLSVQMPNGSKVTIHKKGSDKMGEVKDVIARNEYVPRDHQILMISGKPDLTLVDCCEICEYHKWTHVTVLDMILEIICGETYVCVCYKNKMPPENIILKANSSDTIKTLKYLICSKLNIKPNHQKLKYQPMNQNTAENGKSLMYYGDNMYDTDTLEDHGVALFSQLLNIRVCFLHIENDGIKHVYLVQISDDLDPSHCATPTAYFLRMEYDAPVNKLYSMVADHYKISEEHVLLVVNDNQIDYVDKEVHMLFYPPIILSEIMVAYAASSVYLFSELPYCGNIEYCDLAKRACDDPIIKKLVDTRGDTWEVFLDAFKLDDSIKTKIANNSENGQIRCMDVMHHMYHHDLQLTWEFVEINLRKVDPQLADVIKAQL